MADRVRILVLDRPGSATSMPFERDWPGAEIVRVDNLPEALRCIRQQRYEYFFADPADPRLLAGLTELLQAGRIFGGIADGCAILDSQWRIVWANPIFEKWCGGPLAGKELHEALHAPQLKSSELSPSHATLRGRPILVRLPFDERQLELHITPVKESGDTVEQFVCLARDITAEVQRQQMLDALHRAGLELSSLSTEQVAEMSVEERIEVLKSNIRHFTHDLLHYDVVEIRLLDRETGRLEPLLEEGMTPEAAGRVLYARPVGNGVTGYVASVGKGYMCADTAVDPLYLQGASGARSSLTVPLVYQDSVIGTFNVESPRINAFSEEDLQFATIFCREIASALHTLELLTAEIRSTASRSCEAIRTEVAMPADDILGAATALIDRFVGHDDELIDKLKKIVSSVRTIKQAIHKVGEDMAPAKRMPGEPEPARPRLNGMRVLVVDDDERMRKTAHGILGRWGCIVETARDGHEALAMAKISAYDVIIADIRLPDMTGYEFFRELRTIRPNAHVILMAAYGYDPTHSIVKARQEGLGQVLYKPFRIDQLLDALSDQ